MKVIESTDESNGVIEVAFTEWFAKRHTVYSEIVEYLNKWMYEPFYDTTKRMIETELTNMLHYLTNDGILESYSIDAHMADKSKVGDNGGVEVVFNWKDADPTGKESSTSFYIMGMNGGMD